METIYENKDITITTNGTSVFEYADHNEEVYGDYDYTDIEEFIEDIQYLPQKTAMTILTALDWYYNDDDEQQVDTVNATLEFENLPSEEWKNLLVYCEGLSLETGCKYWSEVS